MSHRKSSPFSGEPFVSFLNCHFHFYRENPFNFSLQSLFFAFIVVDEPIPNPQTFELDVPHLVAA